MSAWSDLGAAIGTICTLFFIAWTVRQQGKALGLQINQLTAEREAREAARVQEETAAKARKLTSARRVRISTYGMDYDSGKDFYGGIVTLDEAERLVIELRKRETGGTSWAGAALQVKNGSDMVLMNLSTHGHKLPRPNYIYRDGATSLIKGYELDQLALGSEAVFIWIGVDEQQLHHQKTELRFSDEDGHRWHTTLEGHTARVDDMRA